MIINAKYVPLPENSDPSDVICRKCVPVRTEMVAIIDVIQLGFDGTDRHTTVFECQKCKSQYAVEYTMEYEHAN
jgi:hypothetical protein